MSLCLNSNNESMAGFCQLNAHYCTGCVESAKRVADGMIQSRDEKLAKLREAVALYEQRWKDSDAKRAAMDLQNDELKNLLQREEENVNALAKQTYDAHRKTEVAERLNGEYKAALEKIRGRHMAHDRSLPERCDGCVAEAALMEKRVDPSPKVDTCILPSGGVGRCVNYCSAFTATSHDHSPSCVVTAQLKRNNVPEYQKTFGDRKTICVHCDIEVPGNVHCPKCGR